MRQVLMLIVGLILAVAIAAWLAVQFLKPLPEGKIVLATGGAGGAYTQLAESWKKELKRFGVELVLQENVESVKATKELLDARSKKIDAAFIRGGYLTALKYRDISKEERGRLNRLRSVGRMFYEPFWVYYRGPNLVNSLGDFRGQRIMIGSPDSGTDEVVTLLLRVNSLFGKRTDYWDPPPPDPMPRTFIKRDFPPPPDTKPLTDDRAAAGAADVAFISLPSDHPTVRFLIHQPDIFLVDFSAQADAYVVRFPFLSKIVMHRGSFRFYPDLPSADITLLATTPALVVREDLDGALVSLLTHVSWVNPKPGIDEHGYPVVFHKAGQFPHINDPEYEVHPATKLYYKSGDLPLLLRSVGPFNARVGIPFWVTAVASQHGTKVVLLAIPILSVLVPLGRFLPMFYAWINRRRLLHWYDRLKALETTLGQREPTPEQLALLSQELRTIDYAVSRLRMPRQFSHRLYELRSHINLVEERLTLKRAP